VRLVSIRERIAAAARNPVRLTPEQVAEGLDNLQRDVQAAWKDTSEGSQSGMN
jgi:hypothetical protein